MLLSCVIGGKPPPFLATSFTEERNICVMPFDIETRKAIFRKTDGKCHICHRPVTLRSYGKDTPQGWEVEHSVPQAKGGTDHLNNLFPAHRHCNAAKGTASSRTARSGHGKSRAPLSAERRNGARIRNGIVGGVLGSGLGILAGASIGPLAILVGAIGLLVDPEG